MGGRETVQSTGAEQSGRLPRWVLITLVIATALYVAGLNSHWRFQRDSAVYMDLARSMLEGRGYVYNYQPHTMYTPGFPAMLALPGAVFGMPETLSDSFLAFNLLVTVLGLGSIALFYLLLRELALPRPVMIAAFLFFVFSRTLYYYSAHLMTDVPFTFFTLAALCLGLRTVRQTGARSWAACAGASVMILLASSIRAVGPLLALAVSAGLWWRHGALKQWKTNAGKTVLLWAILAAFLLTYSVWTHSLVAESGGGRHYFRGATHGQRVVKLAVGTVRKLPGHMKGLSDALLGADAGVPVGTVLALVMLVGLVRSLRRERQLAVFAVLLMGVIIAGGWPLARRYLLPALAVMYLWLALGGATIGAWLGRRWEFWTPRRVRKLGYVCAGLVLAVNVLRIGKVIYENRQPDFYQQIADGRLADYAGICAWLRENAKSGDALLAYESTTVHYLSRVRTVRLPHDTRRRKTGWLEQLIDREDARFAIIDERKPESTAVVEEAIEQHPAAFTTLLESGRTKLLRINADEL